MRTIHFAHVFATLSMVGVIWFLQLVHYPMFANVNRTGFIEYHAVHMRWTSWVVVPLMFIETISAGLMIWWTPRAIASLTLWIATILLVLIWISTFAVQVPLHNRLSRDGDPGRSNCWSRPIGSGPSCGQSAGCWWGGWWYEFCRRAGGRIRRCGPMFWGVPHSGSHRLCRWLARVDSSPLAAKPLKRFSG